MIGAWLRLLGLESGARVVRIVESRWTAAPLAHPYVAYGAVALSVALALLVFLPAINMRWRTRVWTALARLGMGAVIVVALYGLTWKVRLLVEDKPSWVVLLDDSGSMSVRDTDAGSRFDAALADVERVRSAVGSSVDLQVSTFSGRALGDDPGAGPTRFLDAIGRAVFSREPPNALLILTDGRDSEGRDLSELGADIRLRGISTGLRVYGREQPPSVAAVAAAPDRNVIRLGEDFRISGMLTGVGFSGDKVVRISEDGKELTRITAPDGEDGRFEFRHKPERAGRRVYSLEREVADPAAYRNEVRFVVDVVEERINVLLLEGYPCFEFKIVKSVLEVDPLVNFTSICHIPGGGVYVQGTPLHENPEQGLIASQSDVFKYDVIVLQDVPRLLYREGGDTTESRLRNIVEFVTRRGGGLFVKGGQDVYRAGAYEDSALAPILPFDLSDAYGAQPQFEGMFFVNVAPDAYRHPVLQLLPDAAENRTRLDALRELDGVNNVGRFKPMAVPLMTRLLAESGGRAPVEIPVLAEMSVGAGRVLAVAADTMWRWQLQPDFDDPPLTMMLANAVRFLAPPPGRRPGRPNVTLPDGIPQVGQEVELTTELRDMNYDPIREAALEVVVTHPDGSESRIFPRDLLEEPGVYRYRVPIEAPGLYRVVARHGRHEAVREFYAGVSSGEMADLTPDRPAMERLAKAADGIMADDIDAWLHREQLEGARQMVDRDLEVWNSPLALALFMGLVCFDCYIRKRNGLA